MAPNDKMNVETTEQIAMGVFETSSNIHVEDPTFNPAPVPQFFRYKLPSELPPLPHSATESEFYSQWHYQSRVSGLPLVPEQQFYVGYNIDGGNSYWAAIAQLIYGGQEYWPYIKAQHAFWLQMVLNSPSHPRYALYQVSMDLGQLSRELRTPDSYTSVGAWQLTADLYDICLVIFNNTSKFGADTKELVKSVQSRGCRNSSHRFIRRVNGNHFEAMRPAVQRPSEYIYPQVTDQVLQRDDNHQPLHSFLRVTGTEVPEQILPRPIPRLPSEYELALTLRDVPDRDRFSHTPEYISPRPDAEDHNPVQRYRAERRKFYKARSNSEISQDIRSLGLIPAPRTDFIIQTLVSADFGRLLKNGLSIPTTDGSFSTSAEGKERNGTETAQGEVGPANGKGKAGAQLDRGTPKQRLVQPLNTDWEARIKVAMSNRNGPLTTTVSGAELRHKDLMTVLGNGQWLNDEIINAYLEWIVEYANKAAGRDGRGAIPKVVTQNSFFYKNIEMKGPDSVSRWMKRKNAAGTKLLEVEAVLIPINNSSHWTLMVVLPKDRTVEFFDSFGDPGQKFIKNITAWLAAELGDAFHEKEWRSGYTRSPQQQNNCDCGVFCVTNAECVVGGLDPIMCYDKSDMVVQRRRIAAVLLNRGFSGELVPVESLLSTPSLLTSAPQTHRPSIRAGQDLGTSTNDHITNSPSTRGQLTVSSIARGPSTNLSPTRGLSNKVPLTRSTSTGSQINRPKEDYKTWKVAALKAEFKRRKMSGYSKWKKEECVKQLQLADKRGAESKKTKGKTKMTVKAQKKADIKAKKKAAAALAAAEAEAIASGEVEESTNSTEGSIGGQELVIGGQRSNEFQGLLAMYRAGEDISNEVLDQFVEEHGEFYDLTDVDLAREYSNRKYRNNYKPGRPIELKRKLVKRWLLLEKVAQSKIHVSRTATIPTTNPSVSRTPTVPQLPVVTQTPAVSKTRLIAAKLSLARTRTQSEHKSPVGRQTLISSDQTSATTGPSGTGIPTPPTTGRKRRGGKNSSDGAYKPEYFPEEGIDEEDELALVTPPMVSSKRKRAGNSDKAYKPDEATGQESDVEEGSVKKKR